MASYLGLDASTQSLTALLIDVDTGTVCANQSVVFGGRLPQYQSPKGFLANEDPRVVHSDPLMWVEALELLLGDLVKAGVDLGDVAGVSGAGQQHGSVYLARSFDDVGPWSLDRPLQDQVAPLLSRRTAPIWMDSSTSAECAEITAAAGGEDRLVTITGSRAIERFTGPQIRKFCKDAPVDWARTREIHLVSSFMASLLTASSVPIDLGDAAGMNLLDLGTATWSPVLLDATAPGLAAKLRPPVPCATRVGVVASYFVKKFGFAPSTPVIAFSGDNPSSLIGMGASRPGTAVVSLGTSDTVFAAMAAPRTDPQGFGHVFGNPAGGFMALACFANGSLAREAVAQRFGLGWDAFADAIVARTRPGNDGNLLLPYFVPEITPRLPAAAERWFGSQDFVAGREPDAAARAVVEAQALNLRHFSRWIGEDFDPILVTGGASRNPGILRILSDVFQATVVPLQVSNSSALGAALRAAQAVGGYGWADLAVRFSAPANHLAVAPNPTTREVYDVAGRALGQRRDEVVAKLFVKR
jgi:xylulokinase